jgi:hypothetical protein
MAPFQCTVVVEPLTVVDVVPAFDDALWKVMSAVKASTNSSPALSVVGAVPLLVRTIV